MSTIIDVSSEGEIPDDPGLKCAILYTIVQKMGEPEEAIMLLMTVVAHIVASLAVQPTDRTEQIKILTDQWPDAFVAAAKFFEPVSESDGETLQ